MEAHIHLHTVVAETRPDESVQERAKLEATIVSSVARLHVLVRQIATHSTLNCTGSDFGTERQRCSTPNWVFLLLPCHIIAVGQQKIGSQIASLEDRT